MFLPSEKYVEEILFFVNILFPPTSDSTWMAHLDLNSLDIMGLTTFQGSFHGAKSSTGMNFTGSNMSNASWNENLNISFGNQGSSQTAKLNKLKQGFNSLCHYFQIEFSLINEH